MTTDTDKPLRGFYIPAEDRTLIAHPERSSYWPTGQTWSTDTGPAETVLSRWFSTPGRPTALTLQPDPHERTVRWTLKPGVSVPNVDLPATVDGFTDEDGYAPSGAAVVVPHTWEKLYDPVTEAHTPAPTVWAIRCRDVDFAADHPDLIDELVWKADLGNVPWNEKGPRFDMWHPGYVEGVAQWVVAQLKALSLPGVDVYDDKAFAHLIVPGKVLEHASGKGRRRVIRRVPAKVTVMLDYNLPRRVTGEDFLDACRKVRALADQMADELRSIGVECCPTCAGKGYTATAPARATDVS